MIARTPIQRVIAAITLFVCMAYSAGYLPSLLPSWATMRGDGLPGVIPLAVNWLLGFAIYLLVGGGLLALTEHHHPGQDAAKAAH